MKQLIFPKIYANLAHKFLNDEYFLPCNRVIITTNSDVCFIHLYYNDIKLDMISSYRSEFFSEITTYYKVEVDENNQFHYYVNDIEIIDEKVLKEKLDHILSLFNQKAIVHMNKEFEFDINHIEVTPELRNLVNDYLGAVINSLGD